MELTILVTSEPYFACESGIFEQSEGAPMGGPLSGLLADLVLENLFEAKIRTHPKWGPLVDWVRKADDTFFEWTESLELLDEFHAYLNTLHPTIKWKVEVEKDNQIPFLDILILRIGNQIQTTVYRKPTSSDRYIHYTSSQAWKEKTSAIKTLRYRAEIYCSTPTLKQNELLHLLTVFQQNAYPHHLVYRLLFSQIPEQNETNLEETVEDPPVENLSNFFYAPYHPAAAKLFQKLKKNFNINTVYKKTTNLGNLLFKRRPPIPLQQQPGVIYCTPTCSCPLHYIGQTGRTAEIRNKEEKANINAVANNPNKEYESNTYNDYGYIQHYKETTHALYFDNCFILAKENHSYRRKLIKGMFIERNKDKLVNVNAGSQPNTCWKPLLTLLPELDLDYHLRKISDQHQQKS